LKEWKEGILPNADIVIWNYALHYNNLQEYERDMRDLLTLLEQHKATVTSVFRETGAQFFPRGSFDKAVQAADDGSWECSELTDENAYGAHNTIWQQNLLMMRLIPEVAPSVKYWPFYNITKPRHKFMEQRFCQAEGRLNNPEATCLDCSHFLATPTFFAKLFSDLYTII
jgi:hypothetical protein